MMNAEKFEQEAGLLRNQGKGYEAVEKYQAAKTAFLKANDALAAAGCQHMIGVAYKIENDLDRALPAYEQAIADYKNADDILGPGRVERDIGVMYEYHDRLDEAKDHLLISKQLLEAASETATTTNGEKRDAELGITLAKLGLIALRLSEFDEAEKQMMDGLTLIRKSGHPFYEMTALMHLGSLYFVTKQYDRMLANLEAALGLIYEYDMQHEQTRRLAQTWGLMAHGYLALENTETARHFANKSLGVINILSGSARGPLEKDIDASSLKQQLNI